MTEITQLDAATVDRIAAGEVVERPAAAVKELVENSLDAGADSVDVTLERGGTELLRVRDDGHGMTEDEVQVAVENHTTSKIERIDDLQRVGTLGFRGEALHAVAAVSRTTITTRAEGEPRGTELTIEGSEVTNIEPAGRPVGTTVAVEDLFYNVPARRKYLAEPATEFGHCNRVVSRYALANPGVAVSLTHDGRETFSTPGRGDLREAALAVYGREVAESLVPVEADPDALAGAPLEAVHGYVSDPETTRSSREYLATYVNGRYVSEPAVREAVLAGYGGQLAADRFPFAVLFLECPPGAVDVNVHPRKLEVRFADEGGVREAVEATVRDGLLDVGLLRGSAPRGRSAPGDATVAPATPEEGSGDAADADESGNDAGGDGGEAGGDTSEAGRPGGDAGDAEADGTGTTAERVDATAEHVDTPGDGPAAVGDDATADAAPDDATADADTDENAPDAPERTTGASDADAETPPASGGTPDPIPSSPDPSVSGADTGECAASDATPETADGAETADPVNVPHEADADPERKFRPATRNATLPGSGDGSGGEDSGDADPGSSPAFDSLPAMRVLGTLDDTYVVAATDDGLVLVDQHAADERVHYERLAAAASERGDSQRLVEPATLDLTAGEAAVFEDALDDLRALGFEAAIDDGNAVVHAVPAVLTTALDPEHLRDALAEFLADEAGAGSVDAAADSLLSDLACHPAVTGNTRLSEGSVVALLSSLDDCENPYACPHGRPTVIRIGEAEIAERFERDYPGHQTRRPEE